MSTGCFNRIEPQGPWWRFNRNQTPEETRWYQQDMITLTGLSGLITCNDQLAYHPQVLDIVQDVIDGKPLPRRFHKETRGGWKTEAATADLRENPGRPLLVAYRPFDTRTTWFTGKSNGFHARPRVIKSRSGLVLAFTRYADKSPSWQNVFVIKTSPAVDVHLLADQTYQKGVDDEP